MRLGVVIMTLVALWAVAASAQTTELLNPATEWKLAHEAQAKGDLEAALQHFENLIDSCDIDVVMRFAIVDRVRQLRPKVPVDPKKEPTNTWTCLVLVYKNLDFTWTDKAGKKQHVVTTMSKEDIDEIRRGMDFFAKHVLNYSSREMKISYEFKVVERTLSNLIGGGHFWLAPGEVEKDMKGVPFAAYDSVFTYMKMQQKADGPTIPRAFGGGTLGSDIGPKGCGYTNYLLAVKSLEPNKRSGEIEVHEWLHQIDWMFSALYGYPRGSCANPDGGRKVGGRWGGDPDYRLPLTAKTWMPYYIHIMQDHMTRQMWRIASMRHIPETAWNKAFVKEWLVLGPFEKTDGKSLATRFINEETVEPRVGLKTAGKTWRTARSQGMMINLNDYFKPNDNVVAYAHVYVHADTAQLVQLRLGSDDGAAVWHNGQLVCFAPVRRGVQKDRNIVDVELAKGWNRFLFKVDDIGGSWALTARFTTHRGSAVPGLRLATSPVAASNR